MFYFLFGPIPNGKTYILFRIQIFPVWKALAPFQMVRQITAVPIYSYVYVFIYISCKFTHCTYHVKFVLNFLHAYKWIQVENSNI